MADTRKTITEADLVAAMRADANEKAMGMPHPFSERDVASLWLRLPTNPQPDDALREALSGIQDICKPNGVAMTGRPLWDGGAGGNKQRIWELCEAAIRSTPAAPLDHAADCRSMATKANGDCTCGYLAPAAHQPDPCSHGFSGEPCEVHRHLWAVAEPCRDGEHASCPGRDEDGNECGCLCGHVGETAHSSPAAAPQPDTALTAQDAMRAAVEAWDSLNGTTANTNDLGMLAAAIERLRALGEGVES